MKSAFIWLAVCLCLAGCGVADNTPPPTFVSGGHYAIVSTNAVTDGVPRPGTESLYYYPDGPKGARTLIWPFLTADDMAVFDRLVVFNGGASADLLWKYYPALFAYTGEGSVVEISLPACRQIPGWKPDWVNYAFAVLAISNNQVRLDASQRLPLDPDRPKRLEVVLDKAEILKAVAAAQANTNAQVFDGVTYHIAE